ncbi:MAG TPA: translation initiation factor [Candidatus Hydrogenedentes bacterium]|nr:translation initiation factor [Candidatus Hydrogenedentota bacterium]HQM47141.1 translation initiation factor [Candidatus Hydrogenedentota bacterium]
MAKKDTKCIDTSPPSEPLRSQPFAELAARLPKDLPKQGQQPQRDPAKVEIIRPRKWPYQVARTRKGGYDLSFESRAKGKGVTVLRGVSGDAEALLAELKKRCGAGGTVREDAIEIQGDHRKAIEFHFREQGI